MNKSPNGIAASFGSDMVVSAHHEDEVVHVWNVRTAQKVRTLKTGKGCYDAALSSDGKLLAAYARIAGKTRIWDMDGFSLKEELPFGTPRLRFSPGSDKILFSEYQKLYFYDLAAKEKSDVYGFRGKLEIIDFIPGMDAVYFAEQNYIGFWHMLMENEFAAPADNVPRIYGHPYLQLGSPTDVDFSLDGQYVLGGEHNSFHKQLFYGIWRTSDSLTVTSLDGWPVWDFRYGDKVWLGACSFAPEENQIQFFAEFKDKDLIIKADMQTGEKIREIKLNLDKTGNRSGPGRFSPDKKKLAVAQGPHLILFDTMTGKEIARAGRSIQDRLATPFWTRTGEFIYAYNPSSKGQKFVEIYDLAQNQFTHKIPWPQNMMNCKKIILSPDGRTLAFSGQFKKRKKGLSLKSFFWIWHQTRKKR